MTFYVQPDYQEASPGAERHWEIPWDRQEDQAPVETQPTAVLSDTAGEQMCGTILTNVATGAVATSMSVIDFTCSMVYRQPVANAITWDGDTSNAWRGMEIGDFVYYDRGAGAIAIPVKLTISPLDSAGGNNPKFGYIVPWDDADAATFPKGTNAVESVHDCAIMQIGAGAA